MIHNKKKILFITANNPNHPRIKSILNVLVNDIEVKAIKDDRKAKLLNLLTNLNFFDIANTFKYRKLVNDYDIIFIQDMRMLLLSFFAKRRRKIVLYDSLDNMPHLRFYQLTKINSFFKKLSFIRRIVIQLEQYVIAKYCDKVIVNSDALQTYYKKDTSVLYYTSPFENFFTNNDSKNPIASLYLGIFSEEKGAFEILEFIKKYNFRLYIFGSIKNNKILKEVQDNPLIYHKTRIPIEELKNELSRLLEQFFLVGFSLIKPVHYSYKTQEANKDIDYLALGIPIIGNTRKPTYSKLKVGCGILYDKDEDIKDFLELPLLRKRVKQKCLEYYANHYAFSLFKSLLTKELKGL